MQLCVYLTFLVFCMSRRKWKYASGVNKFVPDNFWLVIYDLRNVKNWFLEWCRCFLCVWVCRTFEWLWFSFIFTIRSSWQADYNIPAYSRLCLLILEEWSARRTQPPTTHQNINRLRLKTGNLLLMPIVFNKKRSTLLKNIFRNLKLLFLYFVKCLVPFHTLVCCL